MLNDTPIGSSRPDYRIDLSLEVRSRVERGGQTAYLSPRRPQWSEGDRIQVVRRHRPVVEDGLSTEKRDAPLMLTVLAVNEIEPRHLALDDARRLGFRTLPDLHRDLISADEHMHALALRARVDRLDVHWLTRWSVSVPHERRILGPTLGYVQSLTSPQMMSAGEAVPEDVQAAFSKQARGAREDARRAEESKRADARAELMRERKARRFAALHRKVEREDRP